jgi:tRNA1(Val) A37 N6-methylase TrmN6
MTSNSLFGGRLRLLQPARSHRAGTDAVLLAAACPPANRIADLGAGVGTVGLRAAQMHPLSQVFLFERDPLLIRLAKDNIEQNQLAGRVTALETDLLAKGFAGPDSGPCDLVLTNPPFDEAGSVRRSPVPLRAAAHVLEASLDLWIKAALKALTPDGTMVVIHRADALPRLLEALGNRFGGLALLPVHPAEGRPASRILIQGKRGSKAPLHILPPLFLHRPDGSFTSEAEAIHRGEARIALEIQHTR